MRIRATVAAVTGALALSAFAVPAAQAADSVSRADVAHAWGLSTAASGKSGFRPATAGTAADLDVTFSDMTVNKSKNIVVGTTKEVAIPVTYTLTHAADLDMSEDNFANGPLIYRGSSVDEPTNVFISDEPATCTATSTTVASCVGTIYLRPGDGDLVNADAATWKAGGLAITADGDETVQGDLGTTKVQRYSKLTVNASPEPVKKGRTITVTGALTRANWETNKYAGYTSQSVALQFKKKGATSYTTVKTIKSDSRGNLKTTVTASVDGTFRYSFAGTSTTPAVNSAGDAIDVQ
ncbi:hypothetical protein [Streptomyces avermitilis]|uniref:hypothetical protein n=1 Tax=Streptomyces avermitilis TaxID=33903 RepID=UPI003721DA22